jgi:hypothetical protein
MAQDVAVREMRTTTAGKIVPKPQVKGLATRIATKKKKIFLKVLAKTGAVVAAAKAAGYVDSQMVRRYRKEDTEFAEAWQEALDAAMDVWEAEASRRAFEGVVKGVYFKGQKIDEELQFSDGLAQFMLKANRPEIYGERKRVDVNVEGTVGVAVLPMAGNDTEQWERESGEVNRRNAEALKKEKEEEKEVIDVEYEDITVTTTKRV